MRPYILLGMLALAGCGGGGSYTPPGDTTAPPPPPPPPPPPAAELYALDLDTGTHSTVSSVTLTPNRIVFRRIAGEAPLSSVDALDETGQDDATASQTVAACWLAVHEVTQAQWTKLAAFSPANATPWAAYASDGALGGATAIAADKPAFGVSWTALGAVLTAWNTGASRTDVRVPTAREWEFACRSGAATATRYAWGASEDPAVATLHALVRETRTSTGPATCGSRQANTLGFFDLTGNVWEWVDGASPELRGGSWFDNLRSAASGNRQAMEASAAYPTAGVRLVLELP